MIMKIFSGKGGGGHISWSVLSTQKLILYMEIITKLVLLSLESPDDPTHGQPPGLDIQQPFCLITKCGADVIG